MVGIPTASTSGPLRQSRSPRAVVFSGRVGGSVIAGGQARHRQPACRMSHSHKRTCGRPGRANSVESDERGNGPHYFLAGAFLSLAASVALGWLPPLALLGLATLPLAALASRGAFLYEAGSPNSKFVPALAMNVAVTLLTPSLVAVGLFLTRH